MPEDRDVIAHHHLDALKEREEIWHGWVQRTETVKMLASGDWEKVFGPDEEKMIGNLPRTTIEDGGRLFAEATPMTRVDPEGNDAEPAERRESIIAGYDNDSDIFDSLELFGEDLIAAGLTGIKTLPDFGKPIAERFPRFARVDPQTILPEPRWAPHRPSDNVIVHYRRPLEEIQREFPEEAKALLDRVYADVKEPARSMSASGAWVDLDKSNVAGAPTELELIDWYSTAYISRAAVWRTERAEHCELLMAVPNRTGICPLQLIARPTWVNEPKGQIDDAKGALRSQNRYFRMILDYFVEMVYGPILTWNIRNPQSRGFLQALGPDAKYERAGAANVSFQSFAVLDRLDEQARLDMTSPKSRDDVSGLGLNKATAAFLTTAQGPLNSVVKSLQRAFAVGKRRSNEAALAQDEAWCDAEKKITGKRRGRRFTISYKPSRDIAGDHSNRVTYGTASGFDLPTHQVLLLQKLGKTLDVETFLEQDPMTDDVPQAIARLRRDAMEQSILGGLQLPDTPIGDRLAAWDAFNEDQDLDKVVKALLERQQAAAAAVPVAAPGVTPGLPGPIPGAPAEGAGGNPGITGAQAPALPPMEALRRVASRRR